MAKTDLRQLLSIAAERNNAFTSKQATELGIDPRQLRRLELRGELVRLYPKVWAFAALPATPLQRVHAAVLSADSGAATTTTAAWLHGWLEADPGAPQVWMPRGRGRTHPDADVHQWKQVDPSSDLTLIDHVPTLNKAATLCSLGRAVDASTLDRCLDEFLRTESQRWLVETMDRLGTQRPSGVRALHDLLNDPRRVGGVTDSWFERVLANLIALPWLPPMALQHEVKTEAGNFRLDIACPDLMLGVEAHSRTFHWGADKTDADNVRDLHLTSKGWHVLYVTWSQVRRPEEFAALFATSARKRADQLGIDLAA